MGFSDKTPNLINIGVSKADFASQSKYLHDSIFQDGLTIFAHRGLQQVAPENSIPAITKAKECGLKGVEIDIQTTSDEVPIIHHDSTVDRMTNGTGSISSMTLDQIKSFNIDAGKNIGSYDNLKIPTLDEALKTIKDQKLYVMLHIYDADVSTVIDLVRKYRLENKLIISSFDIETLNSVRAISKEITVSYIVPSIPSGINTVLSIGNCLMACVWGNFTADDVNLAHANGLAVVTDTLTSVNRYYEIKAMNVDMILSDLLIL